MSQTYALHVLRVAVAKICQTIGWHSTHTTTIDLLIDVTQHFLREISRIMQRYCELYNRTEPNLNDLALAYRDIGINMQELMEYIQFVDPITLPFEVPRFPLPRESNLNFLKPGSREMLKRPLHIPWYMPPIFPELEKEDGSNVNEDEKALVRIDADVSPLGMPQRAQLMLTMSHRPTPLVDAELDVILPEGATLTEILIDETAEKIENTEAATSTIDAGLPPEALVNEEVEIPMQTLELKEAPSAAPSDHVAVTEPGIECERTGEDPISVKLSEPQSDADKQSTRITGEDSTGIKGNASASGTEGRPTRRISSVIMTTSGFISPARQGKLPDSQIPVIPEERPPKMSHQTLAIMPVPPTAPPGAVQAVSSAAAASAVYAIASSTHSSTATSQTSVAPALSALNQSMARDIGYPNATSSLARNGAITGAPFSIAAKVSSSTKHGGGEKMKKVKKKPLNRERKKGDKKRSTTASTISLKGAKPPGKEKSIVPKLSITGDMLAGENKEWTASRPPPNLPPVLHAATATEPQFVPGALPNAANASTFNNPLTLPTDMLVLGKVSKPGKTKQPKEKVLKKRKVLHPPADVGHGGDIPVVPSEAVGKTTPKQPKVKGSVKRMKLAKKLQAQQLREQQTMTPDGVVPSYREPTVGLEPTQPPPLIDPWRPSSASTEKFSSPNSAVPGWLPLDAHTSKQKASSKQPGSEAPSEQASQLSLLQMMHPSLEITASPAPDRPHKQSASSKKSGGKAKEPKVPTIPSPAPPALAHDRDVIVIDDDRSPPRTPSLLLSPAVASGASEGKKQRKQALGGKPPATDGLFSMGVFDGVNNPGGLLGDVTTSPASAPLSFRDFSSPEVHASAIPKTPDIKLQSSSSSSASLISETGRAGKGYSSASANLFSELCSMPIGGMMLPKDGVQESPAGPPPGGKKQKRPRQKPPKGAAATKQPKLQKGSQEQGVVGQEPGPAGGKNPFALFSPGLGPYGTADATAYSKYLNHSMQAVAGMPFGYFPLPSGPGLIPDNPLFPRLPHGSFPMGPGGFPLPTNPFGLPGIGQMNNLLRMPRPLTQRHPMGVGGSGSFHHYQNDMFDESLDPETKLAQTPLDLQKSTCNVAPLVPPSLFQTVTSTSGDESLNLSLKLAPSAGASGSGSSKTVTTVSQGTAQKKTKDSVTVAAASTSAVSTSQASSFGATSSASIKQSSKQAESRKEDQVVILPAASVLLGASPPQRANMCVIDVDDSDGSQSTATTGGKSKDGRRKPGKEHKKDRKLKDGKIKKKKDKKDKNKSKEREREQQLKELTAGTASSSGIMTMGMIGAEEALMEQLRKERKEKKEKRKDKPKKDKRKERERVMLPGASSTAGDLGKTSAIADTSIVVGGGEAAGASIPKLTLKLGGSNATPSPRSDTTDHHLPAVAVTTAVGEAKRDGSPELARISALVTRPPKLKLVSGTGGVSTGGGKSKKDDSPGKGSSITVASVSGVAVEHGQLLQTGCEASDLFAPAVSVGISSAVGDASEASGSGPSVATTTTVKTAPFGNGASATAAGNSATNRGSKAPRNVTIAELPAPGSAKTGSIGEGGGTKKPPKDASAKASKSSSSAHHHHATPSTMATPAQMTDVDGNTVWICPACGRVDDGTPMIGCDGCDAWYHWVCVGIQVPPDDSEDWYCRVCIGKKQDSHTDSEKQRKRKKKDKKTPKE